MQHFSEKKCYIRIQYLCGFPGMQHFLQKKVLHGKPSVHAGFRDFVALQHFFSERFRFSKNIFFWWICEVVKMPTKPVTTRHKAIPLLRRNCRFCVTFGQRQFASKMATKPVNMRVSAIFKISQIFQKSKICVTFKTPQTRMDTGQMAKLHNFHFLYFV